MDRDRFVWPTSLDAAMWLGYRENDEFEVRKIEHGSLVEIGNAMAELCRDAAGLEPEELKKQTIRVFGASASPPVSGNGWRKPWVLRWMQGKL